MIKECNFKSDKPWMPDSQYNTNVICNLTNDICFEEDNCILYQIYKRRL